MRKPCYFCGAPHTSKEHFPPKQLFKGFDCDSVTAYSCDTHNTQKSHHDQAIVAAFITSLNNAQLSDIKTIYEDEVNKTIQIALPNLNRSKNLVSSKSLIQYGGFPLEGLPKLAYLKGAADIRQWMKQITAGWIYNAAEKFMFFNDWEYAKVWSFEYFEQPEIELYEYLDKLEKFNEFRSYFNHLFWYKGWSAAPRPYPRQIYHFEICIGPMPLEIIFRHTFYGRYIWYVRFNSSIEIIRVISNKLNQKV